MVGGWDEEILYQIVCEAEETGRGAGLRSERGQWLWAYLYVMTERAVAKDPTISETLKRQADDSDESLARVFDLLVSRHGAA